MDNTNTGTVDQGNPPQSPQATGTSAQPPDGFVEKMRLDKALQKIQDLTLAGRTITEQLTEKDAEIARLNGLVSERDAALRVNSEDSGKKFSELNDKFSSAASELESLRSLKTKLDTAKELGRPDLLPILDLIPANSDKEAQKQAMLAFAGFADAAAQSREKQLLAGVTPSGGGAGAALTVLPTTSDGWMEKINSAKMGSVEKQKLWDGYFAWASQNQTQK